MKKKTKKVLFPIIFGLLLLIAVYFLLAYYYRQGFAVNTWINGVYCTGKSVEAVNAEFMAREEAPVVVIRAAEAKGQEDDNAPNMTAYSLDMAAADYKWDYLTALKSYMAEQKPLLWIDNITFHRNHELTPLVSYNEAKLKEMFLQLLPVRVQQQIPAELRIVREEEKGFILHDTTKNRMDAEKAYLLVKAAIDNGVYDISLSALDCYYNEPLSPEQEQLQKLWEKINAFQQCNLIYDMGAEKLELSPKIMAGFLQCGDNGLPMLDEQGQLVINENAVSAFVTALAEAYDTYGKDREFESTKGEIITLTKGNYGTTIHQKKEVAFLTEYLRTHLEKQAAAGNSGGMEELHVPVYQRQAFARGLNDIGDTYIEIDMTDQKLYYYMDGQRKVETDVVTGNMRRGMGTPSGVYYVYNKQKNRILRGPGYASPVDFWMPVKGGIGIHDADWRDEFGGEIYKKNGSHGCINVPPEIMSELYEMVAKGTPVVMFY